MFLPPQIYRTTLNLTPPDYSEYRKGNHLLIWKDLPHWMVVDTEFYSLLKRFGGNLSLQSLLNKNPELNKHKKQLITEVRKLTSLGILNRTGSTSKTTTPNSQKTPIESIAINITKQCNLKCKYCYNHDRQDNQANVSNAELTADEIIDFLKQTRPFLSKTPSLNILGGEPLLTPDRLLTIAKYAKKHGYSTLVSTNGTKISNNFAKQASKIGLEVQISVDGHNSSLNDPLRGQSVFKRVEEGLDILVKNNVHTIVSMVCCESNFPYLEDYYKWAKSLDIDEARFIPLKSMGAANNENLPAVSVLNMIKKMSTFFVNNPEFEVLAGRDCLSIIANTCRYSNKRISCGTGLQTLLLDADGCIYPCLNTNMPEFKVANIRDDSFSFRKTWRNSNVLQRIRANSCIETMNNTCSNCTVKHWCLGGCRGETYATKGRLDAPSNNCHDNRKSIIEMFWILSKHPDMINGQNNQNWENQ